MRNKVVVVGEGFVEVYSSIKVMCEVRSDFSREYLYKVFRDKMFYKGFILYKVKENNGVT